MCLKQNSLPHRQRGVGLPATIFLISVLALIVAAMSDLNEASGRGFGQDYYSMQAFYAAESGVQVSLNRVFVGGQACGAMTLIDFDAGGGNPGLNNCSADINCNLDTVDSVNYYTFLSTATCGSGFEASQRSIQVRAKL